MLTQRSRRMWVVPVAAIALVLGAGPASADPKPQGAAVIGQGTWGNAGPFTIDARAEKFSTVGQGTLDVAAPAGFGTLHGLVTCVVSDANGMAGGSGIVDHSTSTVAGDGFVFFARDSGLPGDFDYLDIGILASVPATGVCSSSSADTGLPVTAGGLEVFPGHKLKTP